MSRTRVRQRRLPLYTEVPLDQVPEQLQERSRDLLAQMLTEVLIEEVDHEREDSAASS